MVGIIGTGSWASALAQVLSDNKVDCFMYGRNKNEVDDINLRHCNSKYFSCLLNKKIWATLDFNKLNECDIILLAVPVVAFEEILKRLKEILNHPVLIINVSKGFYYQNNRRLSLVIKDILADKCLDVVSLLGPSHAEEVVERKLTIINSVCENEEHAKKIQHLFANHYFRVYRGSDVSGAEIASALKNVMAIASGILCGLGQGDNARAALMTRGLAEMTRFGLAYGCKMETFLGLNGVGDLIVTCSSRHSRNFCAGLQIGEEDSATEFLSNNNKTVEGINSTKAIYELAKEKNIDMPICNEMYKILFENQTPSLCVYSLMTRELKREDI